MIEIVELQEQDRGKEQQSFNEMSTKIYFFILLILLASNIVLADRIREVGAGNNEIMEVYVAGSELRYWFVVPPIVVPPAAAAPTGGGTIAGDLTDTVILVQKEAEAGRTPFDRLKTIIFSALGTGAGIFILISAGFAYRIEWSELSIDGRRLTFNEKFWYYVARPHRLFFNDKGISKSEAQELDFRKPM